MLAWEKDSKAARKAKEVQLEAGLPSVHRRNGEKVVANWGGEKGVIDRLYSPHAKSRPKAVEVRWACLPACRPAATATATATATVLRAAHLLR